MDKLLLINEFGTKAKTARALKVTPQSVGSWPEQLPWSVIGRLAFYRPDVWERLRACAQQGDQEAAP